MEVFETNSFLISGIFGLLVGVSNILGETPVLTTEVYLTSLLLKRETLNVLLLA